MWWDHAPLRELYQRIAEHRTLVVFDPRGTGLPDWSSAGYTPTDQMLDVDAVAQATGLGPFTVLAYFHGCALAATLGAHRPDLTAGLVLWLPWTSEASFDLMSRRVVQSAADDPDFAFQVRALVLTGRMDPEYAEMMRSTVERVDPVAFATRKDFDLTATLPEVRVPTTVVSVRGSRYIGERSVQAVAAAIPNARLVTLDGRSSHSSLPDDYPADVCALLGISSGPAGRSSLRTILFTDLAASTATTQRLGDAAAQDIVRSHNDIVRRALTQHGGHEIKHTGDGIFASFPAASNALDCARAIQGGVADLGNSDLRVKIGLNAGEPIAEEDDLYGTAVQIAARVTDQAEPGEIVCTNVVRELVAGKGYLFSERAPVALKGVEERWPPATRTHYARTADGVDIAYAVIGSGRPTVVADRPWLAGVDYSTRSELRTQRYAPLAVDRALVLFDWRGLGTSGDASRE